MTLHISPEVVVTNATPAIYSICPAAKSVSALTTFPPVVMLKTSPATMFSPASNGIILAGAPPSFTNISLAINHPVALVFYRRAFVLLLPYLSRLR